MAAGLVAVAERDAEGRPVLDVDDGEAGFALVQPAVGIVLGSSSSAQLGTLYITTRRLIWLSDENADKGYAVDFLSLSMHAVSRDVTAFPEPCIYTQIESDGMDEEDEDEGGEDDEAVEPEGGVPDLSKVQEMRLVPQDPSVLDHVFQVLCDCAALNPDPEGEQEGEGEWFFNADEVMPNVIGGGANGHHDISNLVIDDTRYEDAEEESFEE